MSQQVVIDYSGISIKVSAQCENAVHSLCKIDKVLNKINETSKTLIDNQIQNYENYLLNAKEKIKREIEYFQQKLNDYKRRQKIITNNHDIQYAEFLKIQKDLENQSQNLQNTVNELTGSKLEVINDMIDKNLQNAGNIAMQNLQNQAYGIKDLNEKILNEINTIEDIALREITYSQYIQNTSLSLDEVLKQGQSTYEKIQDEVIESKQEELIDELKSNLKSSGVGQDEIENIISVEKFNAQTYDELNKKANNAIIDEKVRKETLSIILKAIRERGFIVDSKKNIKLNKEKDVVVVLAQKADGKTAKFEISLNGKFMYHFDHYEGMACQKDIEPFINDLENIYGIDILHKEVVWENPDKISTQKYQYVKTNKNTN